MENVSQKIGSALKTMAKVGGAVMMQMVIFTGVGILLNVVLAAFLWPEYVSLVPSGSSPGARAGGPLVILIAILYILPPLGLALFFLILMPVLFFLVGKKQGVKAGISKLVHEKGDAVVYFIVSKFTDKMASHPEWKESINKNGIVQTVRKFFPPFIKTLQGLPWILKRPLKLVFEGVDFAGAVEASYRSRPDLPINSPETNQQITSTIADKLKQKFQAPQGRLLLLMVAINIVLFVVAKIVF